MEERGGREEYHRHTSGRATAAAVFSHCALSLLLFSCSCHSIHPFPPLSPLPPPPVFYGRKEKVGEDLKKLLTTFPSVGERNSNFPTRRKIVCKDYCCRSLGRGRIPFQSRLFEGRDGARSQYTKRKNGLSFRSVAWRGLPRNVLLKIAPHITVAAKANEKSRPSLPPPPGSIAPGTQTRNQKEGGREKGKGKRPFSCCTAQGSEGGLHISCLLFPFHPARRRGSYLNCPVIRGREEEKERESALLPLGLPAMCARGLNTLLRSFRVPQRRALIFLSRFPFLSWPFFSAAKVTDQGEESVVLGVVVVWGFWGTVFQSPMYTLNGCIQRKLFLKWVYPEKFFLQNGCIQRKLFFKMGAFTKKLLLQNQCIKTKLCCKMGASSTFLLQNSEKELFCLL